MSYCRLLLVPVNKILNIFLRLYFSLDSLYICPRCYRFQFSCFINAHLILAHSSDSKEPNSIHDSEAPTAVLLMQAVVNYTHRCI